MADEIITNVSAPEATEQVGTEQPEVTEQTDNGQDELSRLKAELAKQKAAIDKATKEASDYKKALRARQTAEEIAAEEKRIADEARDQELADLRKRFAVADLGNAVMTLGCDRESSGRIAEMLIGAEDAKGAILEIQKVFSAREKALRMEFGKIPAPGVGGTQASAEDIAVTRARDIGKARAEADKAANEAMKAYMR